MANNNLNACKHLGNALTVKAKKHTTYTEHVKIYIQLLKL